MEIKKILIIGLILSMLVLPSFSTVWAATSDTMTVTFDPDGTVDINVNPATCAFGTTTAGAWEESSTT